MCYFYYWLLNQSQSAVTGMTGLLRIVVLKNIFKLLKTGDGLTI